MNDIERRFTDNRTGISDRRSGFEHRIDTKLADAQHRKIATRRTQDRRQEDRRKHCMHCGSPYRVDLIGTRACACRVKALQGSI